MLCVRCSHALPPRADRCVRCFALNPENRPAPVAICFDDERTPAPPAPAVTEPDPAPVLTPRFALPPEPRPAPAPTTLAPRPASTTLAPRPASTTLAPRPASTTLAPRPASTTLAPRRAPKPALPFDFEPAFTLGAGLPVELSLDEHPQRAPAAPPAPPAPPPPRTLSRASAGGLLLAWSMDLALLVAADAACIAASFRAGHVRYPLDFLRETAPLFGALFVLTAVAYAALLTALCGRTPGMVLAGHHLRRLDGSAPTTSEAMLRAALALPSAALGLFGFALALFDRRGQSLHDKLSGCITVVD